MKSQDILLLLKLVALERLAHAPGTAPGEPPEDLAVEIASTHEEDALENEAGRARPLRLNLEFDPYSVRGLASATGISKSEVSNALGRGYANGLAKPQRHDGAPVVNRRGLEEFLSYGIRFVFPAQMPGLAVEPLYKTVTTAIRDDETLYRLLAIADSIRLGQRRERKLAVTQLHALLDF